MKSMSLRTKLFLISGLVFFVLCLASSAILYQAQKKQASAEMDEIITNEIIALSTLVGGQPDNKFDFEFTETFVSQYKSMKPNGFFRVIDPRDQHIYYESLGAPKFNCSTEINNITTKIQMDGVRYRFRTSLFRPPIDPDWKGPRDFEPGEICLVVGLDEAPYRAVVFKTMKSTIPILVALFVLLTAVLLILVQSITRDLTALAKSIEVSDFNATHTFPKLPEMQTLEVRVVAGKLHDLHDQAAHVYKEMWLFLGRAAHQIKTPVAAMQATLDVLLRRERTKEELLAGLADVKAAADSLTNLTKKLISSSRVAYATEVQKSIISLAPFFSQQVSIFKALSQSKNIVLEMDGASETTIEADPALLTDLFSNLIENAIIYSGADSKISIRWFSTPRGVVTQIVDHGPGMPKYVLEQLGSPFVRGDERVATGSGLGLSIVKRAATLLKADFDVKSGDLGTEVSVTFKAEV